MYSLPTFPTDQVAEQFHLLGQPARLRILIALGDGESCVCHLEKRLSYRQAYISQQLILLRNAGMVTTRREGKHVYYSLSDPDLLDLIDLAVKLAGFHYERIETRVVASIQGCPCPECSTLLAQDQSNKKLNQRR